MPNHNPKKEWAFLVLLIFVLAFAFQGSRGLWRPDEGRYVRCAYEMVKTGEWIIPQINYTPHFTKPPVTYWLIGTGLRFFGINEWGARFFHALAFALTAVTVGALGRRMWGDREGLLAALVYATSLAPFFAGNVVTTDTILVCFETLAVAAYWMSITTQEGGLNKIPWVLATGFFFGLAFLTKGPPGLLPLAAIVAYTFFRKDARRPSAPLILLGVAVFVATALPWYLAAMSQSKGLFSYFVVHEIVGRIFTAEHNRNSSLSAPLKMYLPILTAGALPWSLAWLYILRKSRPPLLSRQWWKTLRGRPRALFLALWFSLPLFIFCLASSRLPLYVLPLFAPLALVTARGIVTYWPDTTARIFQMKGRPAAAVTILALFLLSSKLLLAHIPTDRDTRAMWVGIRDTIHQKVGDSPYEIVAVHANYDGLAFYSNSNVECLGSEREDATRYIPAEFLKEECDELFSSAYIHVFLSGQKYKERVLTELKARQLGYSLAQAPFGRVLIFCESRPHDLKSVTRLAILGDSGTGGSSQTMLGSTLYHIDQDTSLDGILLVGDNVTGWNGQGDAGQAFEKYFEEPYAPLINNRVPFYAALGDRDLEHMDYQVNYPLFNMNGKRYHSEVFGPSRVEVFLLDSNTVMSDPPQVEWLKRALEASTAHWKVVIMHHPMYSTAKKSGADSAMVALLEPLLAEHKVDVVLCGHNHVYERLQPVKGIQYLTVGSSGNLTRRGLLPNSLERIAGNDEDNVLLVLEFTEESCRFIAYSAPEKIVDEGEIERNSHRQ